MNREGKSAVIASLKDKFSTTEGAFLVDYRGLTVEQLRNLRSVLRPKGGTFVVAKARLMKLAADGLPEAEVMVPYFKEQVALVFADSEAVAVAKELKDFAKENEALTIVAGSMEQQLLDKDAVERVAMTPPREVLLAQVCGTLKAPITGLVSGLSQIHMKLLWTLKQIEEQKK